LKTNEQIINSMLWAAYGDALGFITELCDENTLKYRTGGKNYITELISWKRKIGGMYGINIVLPQGCYSDDTQLRLAVCRSIQANGKFDFETFSKIELPIFLAYGLGKGRGTKAAGESLRKDSIQWNTNFFKNTTQDYLKMGGNGAAIRIQPHIWVGFNKLDDQSLISEIMRDTIITHGNPVAWVGAITYGFMLQFTLINKRCPSPQEWENLVVKAKNISETCKKDPLLKEIWFPIWQSKVNISIDEYIENTIQMMLNDIGTVIKILEKENFDSHSSELSKETYKLIVQSIDAFNPAFSGSAIKTVILSAVIAYYFSQNPIDGLTICVNTLGSDTDSIASMAGAIMGCLTENQPPQKIMDQEFLEFQANRLSKINDQQSVSQYSYPDLLHWKLPSSLIELVGLSNNEIAIYGLGRLSPIGNQFFQKLKNGSIVWQFFKTEFGQTILLSFRDQLSELPVFAVSSKKINQGGMFNEVVPNQELTNKFNIQKQSETKINYLSKQTSLWTFSLDEITDKIIKNGFNEQEIGNQILNFAKEENGIEKAIAFASIVVKAKKARLSKEKK
jgi:ADP-ribosylglycohydrolase